MDVVVDDEDNEHRTMAEAVAQFRASRTDEQPNEASAKRIYQ